jgi:KDO2-lipid IV(A) lauroyltransferase
LNKYLYGVRQKKGQKIINKKGASNDIGKVLEKGASLGFIADQDAGRKGVFIDFFGRKASAYKSIALSAMYYNVPIAVAVSRRVGNKFLFEIEVQRVIMPEEWQDKDNPILWVTQEYNSAFEAAIRKDPSQYWWMHRRWKSQPRVRKQKKV